MHISLGDVSLWFDVSGPSVIPQGDTTIERPVVAAVHGGPGLDHMTVKSALGLWLKTFRSVLRPAGPWPQRSQQRRVLEHADLG
jgi:hypothetical protein